MIWASNFTKCFPKIKKMLFASRSFSREKKNKIVRTWNHDCPCISFLIIFIFGRFLQHHIRIFIYNLSTRRNVSRSRVRTKIKKVCESTKRTLNIPVNIRPSNIVARTFVPKSFDIFETFSLFSSVSFIFVVWIKKNGSLKEWRVKVKRRFFNNVK